MAGRGQLQICSMYFLDGDSGAQIAIRLTWFTSGHLTILKGEVRLNFVIPPLFQK